MLIPSFAMAARYHHASLSRRVNANSQLNDRNINEEFKLIKKGEC